MPRISFIRICSLSLVWMAVRFQCIKRVSFIILLFLSLFPIKGLKTESRQRIIHLRIESKSWATLYKRYCFSRRSLSSFQSTFRNHIFPDRTPSYLIQTSLVGTFNSIFPVHFSKDYFCFWFAYNSLSSVCVNLKNNCFDERFIKINQTFLPFYGLSRLKPCTVYWWPTVMFLFKYFHSVYCPHWLMSWAYDNKPMHDNWSCSNIN